MGEVLYFPAERCKRIPPHRAYGSRDLVARVMKFPGFPPRYRLECLDMTHQKFGWVCLHPDANCETVKQFLAHRRKNAYSISLEWRLEDLSGDFSEFARPYRQSTAVIIYEPRTLKALRDRGREDVPFEFPEEGGEI